MKALVLREDSFGVEDIPSPQCLDGQEPVTVLACGLNHRDQYIRDGQYSKIQYPVVLGSDVCGVTNQGIRAVIDPSVNWGSDARAQGSAYTILGMPHQGGLAEQLCSKTENIYPAPEHLSDDEVACLPIAGVTAYRGLFTRGALQSNQTVLITGIGGGVATLAMKFALAMGADVFVSSRSAEKLERAKEYGAIPIDAKQHKSSIDLVFDSVGGDALSQYLELVRPGGTIVVYGSSAGVANNINLHRLFWKQVNLLGSTMGTQRDFANMLEFVSRYEVRPIIDSVYQLDQAVEAFDRMKNAEQFGKIIVRP